MTDREIQYWTTVIERNPRLESTPIMLDILKLMKLSPDHTRILIRTMFPEFTEKKISCLLTGMRRTRKLFVNEGGRSRPVYQLTPVGHYFLTKDKRVT